MVVEENDRDGGFGAHEDGRGESFPEHNEKMNLFRASHRIHATSSMVLLDMTVPYDVGRDLAETGGSASPIDEGYWLTLIPLHGVTERRFVFN